MKQNLVKKAFIAGVALLSVSAVQAQKEKDGDKNEVQQIIINRKGATSNKTVIEINGDKVKINGKDMSDALRGDVTVNIRKIKDMDALQAPPPPMPPGPGGRSFRLEDRNNFFEADSNRAMLGVLAERGEGGAQIKSVSKESAAEKAGLKEGDIIRKIGDAKIEDAEGLTREIRRHKPGDKVTITYLRDGKEQKVTAELGQWKGVQMERENFRFFDPEMFRNLPDIPNMEFDLRGNAGPAPKLGLSIRDTEEGKGVKVLDVEDESNAAKAGIKDGDIITHVGDEAVNSVDEVSRKVREARSRPSVTFKILRNGKAQTVEIKTPRKLKTTDL